MGAEAQIAGAVLNMMASNAEADVHQQKAREYEEAKKDSEIEDLQKEEQREIDLARQLASLSSSMSSGGVVAVGAGGSVGALSRDEVKMAKKDISSIKLMGLSKRRKFGISADASRSAAKATRIGGFAKSVGMLKASSDGVASV